MNCKPGDLAIFVRKISADLNCYNDLFGRIFEVTELVPHSTLGMQCPHWKYKGERKYTSGQMINSVADYCLLPIASDDLADEIRHEEELSA